MTKTREAILDRGLVIWRDEGVQFVTARRIARDLSMTHGAIAYHFKGQSVLHDAVARHAVAKGDCKLVAVLRALDHPAAR